MDSFAQQMLKEIDQRCKAYQLSNSSINLNEEFNSSKKTYIDIEAKVTNNSEESSKCETIYANSNVIQQNEIIVSINSVPVGRRPALPPKPPNSLRLSLLKPKGYSCIAANSNGKLAKIKIDPAELSLKERLALFEKNKEAVLVGPKALDNNTTENSVSIPNKPVPTNFKRKSLHSPYVTHTKNLIKRIHQQKTIICDIDIESEEYPVTDVCEPQIKHDIEKNTVSGTIRSSENIQTSNIQLYDEIDSKEKSSPENLEIDSTRKKDIPVFVKPKLHINNGDTNREKGYSNDEIRNTKYSNDIRLYGDLTPIVTAVTKMNPDETIGLNDLHPSDCSLLSESNQFQYQPKEEDRWDRFIECLLFFCCVA